MTQIESQIDCPRCNGKGEIPAYRHVRGGICFRCEGACKVPASAPYRPKVQGPALSRAARTLVAQVAEAGGSVRYVPVMAGAAREAYDAKLVTYNDGVLTLTREGRISYQKAQAARRN